MSRKLTESKRQIGDYVLAQVIGEGVFAKVYLGIHSPTNEQVAIKVIDMNKVSDEWSKTRVAREINIMRRIRHPHVIQMYEVIQREQQTVMIMEYAPHGELYNYIVDRGRVDEDQAVFFFRQIFCGVETLHKKRVAHRDLKPENLLLDKLDNVKIADFGLSNMYDNEVLMKTACGSPCYAPPEMIDGKAYVPSATDIWSCGVVLFSLVCGYLPFEDETTPLVYVKIKECNYDIPFFISPSAKHLIQRLLNVDPAKRATFEEIKAHRWFCGFTGPMFSTPVSPLDPSGGCHVPYCVACQHRFDEIDDEVVDKMVAMGTSRIMIVESINWRIPNHISAVYFLMHAKKLRQDRLSTFASTFPPQEAVNGNPFDVPPVMHQTPEGNRGYVPPISFEPSVQQVPRRKLANVPPVIPELVVQQKQKLVDAPAPYIAPKQADAANALPASHGVNGSPTFVPPLKLSPLSTLRPGPSLLSAPLCNISLVSNHPTPANTPRLGDNTKQFVPNTPAPITSRVAGPSIVPTIALRAGSPPPQTVQGGSPRPVMASVRAMENANIPQFPPVYGAPVVEEKLKAINWMRPQLAQPKLRNVTPLTTPLVTPRLLIAQPPLLVATGSCTPAVAITPTLTPRSARTSVPPPPRDMVLPRGTILGGHPLPFLKWPVLTSQQPTPQGVFQVTYPYKVKPSGTNPITRPPTSVFSNHTARSPPSVSRAPDSMAAHVPVFLGLTRKHDPGVGSFSSSSLQSGNLLSSLKDSSSRDLERVLYI